MGGATSKAKDNTANALNVIEVMDTTPHLEAQIILLSLLVAISTLNLLIKIYLLHKRTLRKRYLSRANDLNKV